MNSILKIKISTILVLVVFCFVFFSCDNSIKNGQELFYRAIKDKDTALLRFTKLEDNRFLGNMKFGTMVFKKIPEK